MKFFYPDREIVVDAENREEADGKLLAIIHPKPAKKHEISPKD